MRKKKVYLSGKISDLSIEDYTAHFKQAEEYLLGLGYAVYNPVESDIIQDIFHEFGYRACLAKCMSMLRFCDCIYMLDNWVDSKGAIAERAFADACGIEVIHEDVNNYGLNNTAASGR